ncbi:NADH-quinone oxidoreductase subunit NuoN [Mycolicibacterium komossense]|uniref:NADH-quinone oxidoreductase subunit N n=1 Tax=Mycolicibacterium komossense TaxID=1779 RepID=A0ABT3CKA9_9MYCO|nr:NADH-quinone oxidoreductase subunit NuoN [Mycolicibacterium komossense]MCV7229933.1 NADH-quinone oxidoreductase subunit NuoN [Mycolicibacterium komossense]
MTLPALSIEYRALSPVLIILGAAILGVVAEAFAGRDHRYRLQVVIASSGLAAALLAVVALAGTRQTAMMGAVAIDGVTLFVQSAILLVGLFTVPLIAERRRLYSTTGLAAFTPQASAAPGSLLEKSATGAGVMQTEVFPLTMFAVAGMMVFPAANDLLTMFVALEVLSLPLYLLTGLARHRRLLSQEASLKYFLLGAFSSAVFLFGCALLYGSAGTLRLADIADLGDGALTVAGIGLLAVGLLFKVGAVPFHSWVPDVYQGAPTPITALMAAATKVAAFGAMLRLFSVALPHFRPDWQPVLWAVAILTMVIGAVLAITQTDITRMLAYSAVAQAGFLLIGVAVAGRAGVTSTLFYLAVYVLATVGAFAVIGLVRDSAGEPDTGISQWAGLGRRSPALALAFAVFLLSFAGIPLTGGFIAKLGVFTAAAAGGAGVLVMIGVLTSAVAVFVYARVLVLMFFSQCPAQPPHVVPSGRFAWATIALTAVGTIALGILPAPLMELIDGTGLFAK